MTVCARDGCEQQATWRGADYCSRECASRVTGVGKRVQTRGAGGHRPVYSDGAWHCQDCGTSWVDMDAETMRADPCTGVAA